MAHPKGVLLERAAKLGFERPEFRTEQTGPEHEPQFLSDVIVDGEVLGTGQGGSKRTAETRAAEEALAQLDARDDGVKGNQQPAEQASGGKRSKRASKGSASATEKGGGTKKQAARQEPRPARRASEKAAKAVEPANEEEPEMADDDAFDGPWPMFDDLLAAALQVAERRVNADLRGDAARAAIRDFSLTLYKELLGELGDVVDDDDEDD